jgi:DNA polymerase type B, organellar and viral
VKRRHILDTEDNGKGKVWLCGFLCEGNYTAFSGSTCREDAAQYIYDNPRDTFWAHNLEYDLTNVFGLQNLYVTRHYLGSRLIFGTWGGRRFLDTCNLQNPVLSLQKMGEDCGVHKLDAPTFKRYSKELETYNRRDCEVTEAWIQLMEARCAKAGVKLKATLPATALAMFQKFYVGKLCTTNGYRDFLRRAYAGGRTEIFLMGRVEGEIHYADINSMYPSVMHSRDYPSPETEYEMGSFQLESHGVVDVTVDIPCCDIPLLWVRRNGRTIFPVGVVRGCWTMPEIRALIRDGGKLLKFHSGIGYACVEQPFNAYIDYCHALKQEADTKPVGKFLMNSLYGKFGQIGEGIELGPSGRRVTHHESPHANVIWAAYVTAYARLKLGYAMRATSRYDREVLYCDTDSIIYRGKKLWDGHGLGELEHKDSHALFHALLPKVYRLDDNYRAKGVPQSQADHFFKYGKAAWERPTRLREALVRGETPNVWGRVTKERHAVYDKRFVHRDGTTTPHTLINFTSEEK